MLKIVLDENLNGRIYRGLQRVCDDLDAVRVQDVGLQGEDDPAVLEWAAENGRVLVSHDLNTIPMFAHQRTANGEPMFGLIMIPESMPIGSAIEELQLVIECTSNEEFQNKVEYLPM